MNNISNKDLSSKKDGVKILFLGYSSEKTKLIELLIGRGCEVFCSDSKIDSFIGYDLVISFGYKHIITKDLIAETPAPIINLHISYLPWNRGAHPNFWSFYDCTPSGVTIHLVDEGIDTGPIIYQRYVNFNKLENTYSKTYSRLMKEIEQLFIENIDEIISKSFSCKPQRCKGTFHRLAELPKEFHGWDSDINKEVAWLDSILGGIK
jgi:hypothetical protein